MIGRQKVSLVFTNQLRQKLGVMFGDRGLRVVVNYHFTFQPC